MTRLLWAFRRWLRREHPKLRAWDSFKRSNLPEARKARLH